MKYRAALAVLIVIAVAALALTGCACVIDPKPGQGCFLER